MNNNNEALNRLNAGEPVLISEVIEQVPEIKEIMKKIESGELSLGTGDIIPEWTDEKKEEFKLVLNKYIIDKDNDND